MKIHQETISKAIRMLTATGCRFHVVDSDGNTYGTPIEAVKDTRRHRIHNFRQTGYIDRVRAMIPGEVLEFEPPPGASPVAFQKAITAQCVVHHGKGNCTSTVDGDKVQVLRVI